MANRLLSNSEMVARFRNRGEEKNLEDKLAKMTKSLCTSKDFIKEEIHTWRQFVQKTSRNSGWSPRSLRPELGEDVLVPTSTSRAGQGNAPFPKAKDTSGQLTKPWAYTFNQDSHNKVYRELHQAGTNCQKNLALRNTAATGKDTSNEEPHPKMAEHVFSAAGMSKVRSKWCAMPRLANGNAGCSQDDTVFKDMNQDTQVTELKNSWSNRNLARQVSNMRLVNHVRSVWLPKANGNSRLATPDKEEGPVSPDLPETPRGKARLVRNVSNLIELKKSIDAFVCSECGSGGEQADVECKLTKTALTYKGLQRAKSILSAKKTQLLSNEIVTESSQTEDVQQLTNSKCCCNCRKARRPLSEIWTKPAADSTPVNKNRLRVASTGSESKTKDLNSKTNVRSTQTPPPTRKSLKTNLPKVVPNPTVKTISKRKERNSSSSDSNDTKTKPKEDFYKKFADGKFAISNDVGHNDDASPPQPKGATDNQKIEPQPKGATDNQKIEPKPKGATDNQKIEPPPKGTTHNQKIEPPPKGTIDKQKIEARPKSTAVNPSRPDSDATNKQPKDPVEKTKIAVSSQDLEAGPQRNSSTPNFATQRPSSHDEMLDAGGGPGVKVQTGRGTSKDELVPREDQDSTSHVSIGTPCQGLQSSTDHKAAWTESTAGQESIRNAGGIHSGVDKQGHSSTKLIPPLAPLPGQDRQQPSKAQPDPYGDGPFKAPCSMSGKEKETNKNPDVKSLDDVYTDVKPNSVSRQISEDYETSQRKLSICSKASETLRRSDSQLERTYTHNRKLINIHKASSVIKYANSFLRFELERRHSVKPSHRVVKGDDAFTRIAKVLLHKVKVLRRFRQSQLTSGEDGTKNKTRPSCLPRQWSMTSALNAMTEQRVGSLRQSESGFWTKSSADLNSIQEKVEVSESGHPNGDPESDANVIQPQRRRRSLVWDKAISRVNMLVNSCNTNQNNTLDTGCSSNNNKNNNSKNNNNNNNNTSNNNNNATATVSKNTSQHEDEINNNNSSSSNDDNKRNHDTENNNNNNNNNNRNNENNNNNNTTLNTPRNGNAGKYSRGLSPRIPDGSSQARMTVTYHRGIRLSNYVIPERRYKQGRRPQRSKQALSIRWHSAVGVMVNARHSATDDQALDTGLSKEARHRQLVKMVEKNHAQAEQEEVQVISHALKARIDEFMESVGDLCPARQARM